VSEQKRENVNCGMHKNEQMHEHVNKQQAKDFCINSSMWLSTSYCSACRVTVSSYPDEVKASVEQLVSIMGGRYSTSLSKKNSHLLIRAAAGPKFAGCAGRGVIPVTADWLIESAHAGMYQPHLSFIHVLTTCSLRAHLFVCPLLCKIAHADLDGLFVHCKLVMSCLSG